MKMRWLAIVIVAWLVGIESAQAQLEFLKGLFGGKAQPAARVQEPFRGHQALNQAVVEAEKGDVAKSLKLVAEAFQHGGVNDPLQHPEAMVISQNVLRLCRLWEAKKAEPAEVAAVLLDAVFPPKSPGTVRPYVGQWQLSYDVTFLSRTNSRFAAPESVGAELVRWSVLAKKADELKKRLQVAKENAKEEKPAEKKEAVQNNPADRRLALEAAANAKANPKLEAAVARVLAVQLAVAEKDGATANKALKVLLDDATRADQPLCEYLLHAVSASVRDVKSEAAGLELLEAVLARAEDSLPVDSGLRGNAAWLRVQGAEAHARAGRKDEAKRWAIAASAKPFAGNRFGADYGAYLDYLLKQRAAAAMVEAGAIVEGLDLASVPPDAPAKRYFRSGNSTINFAAKVGRQLRALAPAARYELLRTWALPDGDRTHARSIVDLVPNDSEPRLGSGLLLDVYGTNWELVATARELGKLDELVRELSAIKPQTPSVGTLRTLAMVMHVGSASESKGTTTRTETAARLKVLLDVTKGTTPQWNTADKPEPPLETYVIAVEAALHPEWRDVAEQLLRQLIEHAHIVQAARQRDHFRMAATELMRLRTTGGPATSQLKGEQAKQRADGATSPLHIDWLKLRPKMWDVIGFETAADKTMGALSPTWFTYEGYLSHVSTGRESDLVFALPLTGTFEVSLEGREGGWTEGRAGYGGAATHIFAYQDTVSFYGKGYSGSESSPKMTNLLNKEPWNRYTIRVAGDSVKYYANGQLVFEDQPGAGAPWLTVGGTAGWTPSYRNFRITGSPTIPREVNLLGDARLRGWLATYFEESKPDAIRNRQYIRVKVKQPNGSSYETIVEDDGTMEGEPAEVGFGATDWTFEDGELRSPRRTNFWGGESPSWLSYQRPLRDGETLHYDFFHAVGQTEAHPTFGEVVYALGGESDVAELVRVRTNALMANNGSLTTSATKTAALKSGWNSVAMSLRGGTLTIELNGEVARDTIAPTNSRRIGFYHDAATSDLRVRNVVLTGDWPKDFDDSVRAAIESPQPTEPLKDTRFLLLVPPYPLNESLMSDNAYEIARRAVKLETPERYKFLHRWVMPNDSHDLLRLAGAFTPTHPAPPVLNDNPIDVATAEARQAVDPRMVQTGGNFVCPAILLVLAAAELDRLSDLKQEVTAHDPASSIEMARNRAAMLGLIELIEGAPDEANTRIHECQTLLLQQLDAPMYSRWGDVALASLAIQHPVTRDSAFELLEVIQRKQLQASKVGTSEFARFVRQLHGQAVYLMHGGASEEFGSHPKTPQWRTVPLARARSRGTGIPITAFDVVGGEMAQRGGHDFDGAYFQSPLRGNYEVRCRLSHFDYREAMLMNSGIAAALRYTHNEVKLSHVRNGVKELPLAENITPHVQQWHDYKIVVKDRRFRSYVNGQLLYEESLPAEHDPWLAVVGWAGYSSQAVRDIVITGNPVIPKELDLLGSPDLRGWMTDYFAAEWGQSPFAWKLADGELTSPQTLDQAGPRSRLKIENILRYHRPMIEDGEISYEFFYDPDMKIDAPPSDRFSYLGANAPKRTLKGKTVVHPALDRIVCMLEPDGVKIHWLTDGRWDRTGLTADNVDIKVAVSIRDTKAERAVDAVSSRKVERASAGASRSDAATIPLKPNDWNSVKFTTKGDTLTIELNGQPVFEREIEPTNLRHFGLFHYANESNVRVRNVRYRGDWPTTLPSVADQDLAGGPRKLAAIPDADLPDSISWDFTKNRFKPEEFHYVWSGASAKHITPTEAGLRFLMPASETKPQIAGIAPAVRIVGDFITTIEYEGLKTTAAEEQWGSGLSFKANLDGSYGSGFEVRHLAKSATKVTRATKFLYAPNRPGYFHDEAVPEFLTAGRLRIQRRSNVMYYFIAEPGSEDFRLLTQFPLGTIDVKHLIIQADASDKASGSEFVLKNLSIRAAKIVKGK